VIDRETAYQLVQDLLKTRGKYLEDGDTLQIIDASTIETDYGWVFFWNSRKFLETKKSRYYLSGNGPFVVEKADGSVHQLGSAGGSEYQVELYEARRNNQPTPKPPVVTGRESS
jgi:hypothetical protein